MQSCSKTNHKTQVGRSSKSVHSSILHESFDPILGTTEHPSHIFQDKTKTLQLIAFCFCCCFSVPTSGRRIEGRSITDLTDLNEEIAWSKIGARLLWGFERQIIIDPNVECHRREWKWYRGQTQRTNNLWVSQPCMLVFKTFLFVHYFNGNRAGNKVLWDGYIYRLRRQMAAAGIGKYVGQNHWVL